MRTIPVLVMSLLLLAPVHLARAEPPEAGGVLEQAIAAFEAKDEARLAELARDPALDLWAICDRLYGRGHLDAAKALAGHSEGEATAKLGAYLDTLDPAKVDQAARDALTAFNDAMDARDGAAAMKALAVDAPRTPMIAIIHDQSNGIFKQMTGQGAAAVPLLQRSAKAATDLGWYRRAFDVQRRVVVAYFQAGDVATASEQTAQLLALAKRLGDPDARINALQLSAALKSQQEGLREASLPEFEECLAYLVKPEHRQLRARVLNNTAAVLEDLDRLVKARAYAEESLAIKQELGDRLGVAASLTTIGGIEWAAGNGPQAIKHYRDSLQRSLTIAKELESTDPMLASRALQGAGITAYRMGFTLRFMGRYAEALDAYIQAAEIGHKARDMWTVADSYREQGYVLRALGRPDRARELYAKALPLYERMRKPEYLAMLHQAIGAVAHAQDDHEGALEAMERARALYEQLGYKTGIANILGSIAIIHIEQGRDAEAAALLDRAIPLVESTGRKDELAGLLTTRATLRVKRDDQEGATADITRAMPLLSSVYMPDKRARAHATYTRILYEQGKFAEAASHARTGMTDVLQALRGLDEQEAAALAGHSSTLCNTGAVSAWRAEDVASMLWFLERGRGQILASSLGSRADLRAATTPADLLVKEQAARQAERGARDRLAEARRTGKRKEVRRARAAFAAAQAGLEEVLLQIGRKARQAADADFPEPVTLDRLRTLVPADAALVMYHLHGGGAAALILDATGERIVSLGDGKALAEAAGGLVTNDAEHDPSAELGALRARLIDPLALPAAVKQVFVSATGTLSYVPFSALMPDHAITVIPSATTLAILAEGPRTGGSKVLALGDPQYGSAAAADSPTRQRAATQGQLVPLPATRKEVETVGDVVLLGADATEEGLHEALAKRPPSERWRAVHFACHGLVDMEKPQFSCLALTGSATSDGFFRAAEIARTRIRADLVVLSACETARGKVYKSEGILGLTRTFMFAGAPRVICSLWKVDDAATQALMIKFYELWNPKDGSQGLGTAEALRLAQAHVRSQPPWKHPYYWAAWTLWGLSD